MASNSDRQLSVSQNVLKSEIQPGRNKVALKPGRSLLDWIRLTSSNKDLTGVGGKFLNVTPEELAKHNKKDDAWISLKGKVYNITPYMEYHPGGVEELMKGVGKDATDLFNEVHRWVNAESMLQKCLVGKLKVPLLYFQKGVFGIGKDLVPTANTAKKKNDLNEKDQKLNLSYKAIPTYEWFQSDKTISLVIHTRQKDVTQENVIVDLNDRKLSVTIRSKTHTYQLHIDLEAKIQENFEVKTAENSDIVELLLFKVEKNLNWKDLGKFLQGHNTYLPTKEKEIYYRPCTLSSKKSITHNTYLFTFNLPTASQMLVPIGYHVHINTVLNGVELIRSYTPVLPNLNIPNDHPGLTKGNELYLMIKIYPDGAMTTFLDQIEVGGTVNISSYDGDFDKGKLLKCTKLVLLAAGTGFTPMVKLIQFSLNDKNTERTVLLVFFNREEKDIFWHEELNALEKSNKRFQVKYVLSEPHEKWIGLTGHVQKSLLESLLPQNEKDILICICGPTIFTKKCLQYLEEMKYSSEYIHAFLG
ncbi:cytochrome b5 reductase 4 isoform X2 [Centruroides vittatus]|uniref:cytochrome b5 reductase 4 isoform X2 n=1 Tax=Centruroides vittatus TaxID=120091 RepID=UPI003510459D